MDTGDRERIRRVRLTRTKLIMLGFLVIILIGACLLMLPFATRNGQETSFLGALFTAVSATCVTGLVVYDTWSHWTLFGQLIILTMIQIGGLGFITIGMFALTIMGRKIGLGGRELIHDSLSTLQVRGSIKLVRRIVFVTLSLEGIGALLLSLRFVPEMGMIRGVYYGIFHAISAFCNAGFDLMGCKEEFGSLCAYVTDPLVSGVLMALIIIGGIGFIVWEDLIDHRLHWKSYRFQTKIVLSTTAVLIVGGTVLFLLAESGNLFADIGIGGRITAALFCAITPRTAGFNTVDTALLTDAGLLLTICLMFIGGSPGSTAGGVKTTTIAVIVLYIKAYLFGERDCVAFGRRLDQGAIRRASVVVFVNILLALTGCMALLMGQGLPLRDTLFEVFSALGTSGMSTGLTRDLNMVSRIVIMVLMFCGRIGSLTFAMSFTEHRQMKKLRYPEEQVIVG